MKTLLIAISTIALGFQSTPQDIPKKDLPKAAECVICSAGGANHGLEKPAGGVMYNGKAYYFCNSKEIAEFKKNPEAYLPPVLPRAMPAFEIKDAEGKVWNAESMKGKLVLIDFWASWCGPCKEMMPALDNVYAKYKERGFVLLSVSVDQKKADLDKFLTGHKFPNPVLHDTTGVYTKWGVRSIPATFLIKDGQVIAQWSGVQTEATLDTAIAAHLVK